MLFYESIRPISAGQAIGQDKKNRSTQDIVYPAYINFKLYMKMTELEAQGKSMEEIKRLTHASDLQIQAYKNTKARQIQVKGY